MPHVQGDWDGSLPTQLKEVPIINLLLWSLISR